jgi:hypothetical protein
MNFSRASVFRASNTPRAWNRVARIGWLLSALSCVACSGDDKPAQFVAAGALATPAGTGGMGMPSGGAAAPSGASFGGVLAIFSDPTHNCAACHSNAATGGGLVFNPANAAVSHMALVGVASPGAAGSKCGGKIYVVAGQPDASLLYDKLSNATPSCGTRMPMGLPMLTSSELSTVRSWITGGALNN